MRFLGKFRRKKPNQTLPVTFSSGESQYAASLLQVQDATLALPTKLDEVTKSVHECIPQQLPGEQAGQDDVRYFLYQILTLKDHNLARRSPQWVLETCMLWQGGGKKLRSLPLDAFQQLCPLHPGYAVIDWTVKGSKFRRQDIPPCGIRDEIGYRIKDVVENLKMKEQGHRGPGWRNADSSNATMASVAAMGKEQNPELPANHIFQTPSFKYTPSYPVKNHFYSLGNHSTPLLHRISPAVQQTSPYMYRPSPFGTSSYVPQAVGQMTGEASSMSRAQSAIETQSVSNRFPCDQDSPISTPGSPASSVYHPWSLSSQNTDSTAQTSPLESDSENQVYRSSPVSGMGAKPSRYKSSHPARPTRLHDRSFHPAHHLEHLRSSSYDSNSAYASSEISLSPSDSAIDEYGFRRDSVVPPEITQESLRRRPTYSASIASTISLISTPKAYASALPFSRSLASPTMGTATPFLQEQSKTMRPIKNYKVHAHALDMAECVGRKSVPGPMRSMMVNGEWRHKLTRGKSDGGLNIRLNDPSSVTCGAEAPVGPLLRFQNPRTGQPRLTIYETIEQRDMLGKQPLENQRRIEMQQGRLRTVYETIEEQELLDGKPQRGVDTYVGHSWSTYL